LKFTSKVNIGAEAACLHLEML